MVSAIPCPRRGVGLVYLRHWIVSSFYRDQEYQDWLYAQGRTCPGAKVTWTKNSRHTSRRAWDVVIKDPKTGKLDWRIAKADVNLDQIPDYEELADVGRKMGLTVGGWWSYHQKAMNWVPYQVPTDEPCVPTVPVPVQTVEEKKAEVH